MHPTRPDQEDLHPGHCTRGPHDNPRAATGAPPDAAEHRDSYPPWPVVVLLFPFLLALPPYPRLWLPISAVPVADAPWALPAAILGLFGARGNPPVFKGAAPQGGPA